MVWHLFYQLWRPLLIADLLIRTTQRRSSLVPTHFPIPNASSLHDKLLSLPFHRSSPVRGHGPMAYSSAASLEEVDLSDPLSTSLEDLMSRREPPDISHAVTLVADLPVDRGGYAHVMLGRLNDELVRCLLIYYICHFINVL